MGFGTHTGATANPHGRPRRGTRISDHLQDLIDQADGKFYELRAYLEKRGKTKRLGKITMGRLLAARMLVLAFEGNTEMIKEILNRTEGRVIENLHISKRREINFSFSMSPPAQTGYNLETIPFLLPMFCVILSF